MTGIPIQILYVHGHLGITHMIPLFNDFKNSYTEIGLPVVLQTLTLRTDFEEINRLG